MEKARMASIEKGVGEVLVSREEIDEAVARIGKAVTEDFQGEDLVVIGILKGAVAFMADLMQAIDLPLEIDFMAVSSYGTSTTSTGEVRILKDLECTVEGRSVLIVEDIIDTGITLSYLSKVMESRGAKRVSIAALLTKPARRERAVQVDYVGYEVEDKFVVGYGIDYAEKYRNLPYVGALKPSEYEK
ncbi:Hypoxanthine-guanine phosphoribosyltransferase [Aedoeadaptatus ivorii]|uniref:Hypoxanthine phosphoribosyltransferase n=1 Tax=Aedoeadaptatus ivorii TaxID=54006 RepID=A0A3S5F7U3_9FIRM|nr:hypoxanthine phosphoribosyltransferase [Peptoniphilus ivorii]MDQ0509060.1 hypoxanthine phosphoribosyltransferase [Peptoniphilus ivorii]VEJ35166.1 Hypoxanthine-guanine phosphoribosyltransferase [Peptoniphilus ivorii]